MYNAKTTMKGIKYELQQVLYDGGINDKNNFEDPLHKKLSSNHTEFTKISVIYANANFRARLDIADKELPLKMEIYTKKVDIYES